jgi:hypothetical protein
MGAEVVEGVVTIVVVVSVEVEASELGVLVERTWAILQSVAVGVD